MTNTQINAINTELWQNIGAIAGDDTLMRKLALYTRRLLKEKKTDSTLMTKEEFFARIKESEQQAERGEVTVFHSKEEMNKWLNSL